MPSRVTRSLSRQSLGDTNGADTNANVHVTGGETTTRGTKRIASAEDGQGSPASRGSRRVEGARTDRATGTGADQGASRGKRKVPAEQRGKTGDEVAGQETGVGYTEPAEISVKKTVKKQETEEEEEEEEEEEKVESATKTTRRKKGKTKRTTEEELVEMKPLAPRTQGLRMYIGAHVSAAKGIHNSITNSVHVGGNALALFLKSQRKWDNPPLQDDHRDQFRKHCTDHTYDAGNHILPHGSYLVNLAQEDPAKAKQAYSSFLDDLKRCEELGIGLYNFHPGATNQTTLSSSLSRIAKSLTTALDATHSVIPVLETTCGHGTSIGGPLTHFSQLFSLIPSTYHARLGVCVDTCHTFAAGYDLRSPRGWDEFMTEFDQKIGLRHLRALHLNDSKTPWGSRRDLHANIGTGFLGLRGFHNVMNDRRLEGLPMILETPIDRPADETVKNQDEEGKEASTKHTPKKMKKTPTTSGNSKSTKVEDKGVWAREIKLLESLIGMDPESEEFRALEEKLAEEGREEREKQQALFDKKVLQEKEKQDKAAAGGGSKKGRKTTRRKVTEVSEEESEESS